MYLYALLPLRLSLSTNLPSAIHLLPHFASVANTEPTLSYIHIGTFAEKRKKIGNPDQVFWITAGICGTFFEDFLLFGQYRTWCILRIMNDPRVAQRAQVWFFPFFSFLFLSFSFFFFLFLFLSFTFPIPRSLLWDSAFPTNVLFSTPSTYTYPRDFDAISTYSILA